MRADRAAAVVPSLQERLIAKEDRVPDLERMRVQDQHAEADAHAVAERFAQGSQDHAALPGAADAVDERGGGVAFDQRLSRFPLPKARGFRDLLGRILRDLLNAVDRLDDARAQLPFMNERTESATRSSCSSVSSANIGNESTSDATLSVIGMSPWR